MHEINLYQTHLTEGQWSYINKEFLENDRRKRKYSLQSVFEAILYLLVSGCQWRRLPHDYPAWKSVYYYYHKWRQEGRVEHFLEKLVRKIRRKRGQASSPSVGAMDAQSVRWGSRQGDNGYDGNKKVKGVKRNIITDRNGFILARKVCNAGIHDSKMAHELCGLADDVWEDLRKVLCDRGYRGDVDKDIEKDFGIELEVSNTPNGVKGFLPKPLRWVVERTFAWLDSCRRLARNYEILNESAEEMIDFAAIKFLINKI